MPVNRRTYKILVFGDLAGKENDYKKVAKHFVDSKLTIPILFY